MPTDESHDDRTQSFVALSQGTMVSHYRIAEKIGAGGMGEVYLAEDTSLKRHVALKFMPAHAASNIDMRNRFTREARAVAALNHPNIVTIYEVGEFNGRPFFAMEHVPGESLRTVIKKDKLTIDEAVRLMMQICEGLHKAHEMGVVHRDVKPGNIIIDNNGRAKLLDFGLALVSGEDKLTKTGSTLGTIGYMSPEQVRGDKADHRSDLFSVGVILYEMLTGRRPFEGENEIATSRSITDAEPEPLARYKSGIPVELQQIVDKALSKDPALRYQHADGMLSDLKRLEIGATLVRRIRIGMWAAVAVVVLMAAWLLLDRPWITVADQGEPQRIMVAVLPFENLGDPDDEYFADGITEEITSRLGMIRELGVISRTSAMQFKNSEKSLPQIAEELGVEYVLEGTVRWDRTGESERVRITPQLIQVQDNTHLWTDMYESELTGIFVVQGSIASEIAAELDVALVASQREAMKTRPTENMGAYKAYLRGQELERLGTSSKNHWLNTIEAYERAVELDSNFAQAYAGLSMCHMAMYNYNHERTVECLNLARLFAERSIAIPPDLAEGHTSLAVYYFTTQKYDSACRELDVAERLRPSYARIYWARGIVFARQGNYDDAIPELLKAERLNPLDGLILVDLWSSLRTDRQYGKAIEYADKMISLHPDKTTGYQAKAVIYYEDALDLDKARNFLYELWPSGHSDAQIKLELLSRNYRKALELTDSRHFESSATLRRTRFKGRIFRAQGIDDSARVYYDSVRIQREPEIADGEAVDELVLDDLADCYAVLGRHDDAIRSAKESLEIVLGTAGYLRVCKKREHLAEVYVMVGEYDLALEEIDYLLSVPSRLSVGKLKTYPVYDPLRDHPRFQALIEKYEKIHGI